MNEKDIAIIGISLRLSGSNSVDEFWNHLIEGKDCIEVNAEKDNTCLSNSELSEVKSRYSKIKNIDLFDAKFFNYTAREASRTDPQFRLLLECAWHALEDSGYATDKYHDEIGIYAGSYYSTYLIENILKNKDENEDQFIQIYQCINDLLATNIAYKLDLRGPSITVQSWCTTALSAIHFACQSLRNDECKMALAGGVTVLVPSEEFSYQDSVSISPDGRMRSFDKNAQGSILSNGLGIIVMKKLKDAINDRDNIYAVLKGTGITNDGHPRQKLSYQGVTIDGQYRAIKKALSDAKIDPDTISYVEANGLASEVSDRLELTALAKAYEGRAEKGLDLVIGSVKPNMGHLVTASGIPHFIKACLSLKNRTIPPTINFSEFNPRSIGKNTFIKVNTQLLKWPNDDLKKRVGLNSFGFGGTNIHMILEEAPKIKSSKSNRNSQIMVFSARTPSALSSKLQQYINYFEKDETNNFEDIVFTNNIGRKDFEYRFSILTKNKKDAVKSLKNAVNEQDFCYADSSTLKKKTVFVFPGDENEYKNVTKDLYLNEPSFNQYFSKCSEIVEKKSGIKIEKLFFDNGSGLINDFEKNIAIFILEYSLAKILIEWGIKPAVVLGYGYGELVASCISGIFELEDAITMLVESGITSNDDKQNDIKKRFVNHIKEKVKASKLNSQKINHLSCVVGDYISSDTIKNPDYWEKAFYDTLDFKTTIKKLINDHECIFVEVGASNKILHSANDHNGLLKKQVVLTCVDTDNNMKLTVDSLLQTLCKLWENGRYIDWNAFYSNEERKRISLPCYPFQRERYWINTKKSEKKEIEKNQFSPDHHDVDQVVKATWSKLFGIEKINLNDGFLDLGGDSLIATMIINRLKSIYKYIDISYNEILNNITLSEMIKSIKKNTEDHSRDNNDKKNISSPFYEQFVSLSYEEQIKLLEDYIIKIAASVINIDKKEVKIKFKQRAFDFNVFSVQLNLKLVEDVNLPLYEHEISNKPDVESLATYIVEEINKKRGIFKSETKYTFKKEKLNINTGTIKEKNKSMAFILSSPRSGSTLLRLMLAGHSKLFCPPELHLLGYSNLKEWRESEPKGVIYHGGVHRSIRELFGYDQKETDAFINSLINKNISIVEIYKIIQEKLGNKTLVDKSPDNTTAIEKLQQAENIFDTPKYIYLIRHPYAVIESNVRVRSHSLYGENIENPYKFAEEDWIRRNKNLTEFFNSIGQERVHLVKYEEITKNPKDSLSGICNFLNIDFEEGILHPYNGKRMIDGLGDPNILNHNGIDPELGEVWKKISLPYKLSDEACSLAEQFNYYLPNEFPAITQSDEQINDMNKIFQQNFIAEGNKNLNNLSNEDIDEILNIVNLSKK